MKYDYIRVSTKDQGNILREKGVQQIEREIGSAKTVLERPVLTQLIDRLKEGDELWGVRLDPLARSLVETLKLIDDLKKNIYDLLS